MATIPLLPAWSEPRSRSDSHNRHYGERVASNCVLGRQIVVGELNGYERSPRFEAQAMHTVIQRSGDWQETIERFSRMCLRLFCCNGRNQKRLRAFKTPKVIYASGAAIAVPIVEFRVDQQVEYRTWEGINENYKPVWKMATVQTLGPKKILIKLGGNSLWVQKQNLRPVTVTLQASSEMGINQQPEQLALF